MSISSNFGQPACMKELTEEYERGGLKRGDLKNFKKKVDACLELHGKILATQTQASIERQRKFAQESRDRLTRDMDEMLKMKDEK